MSAREEERLVSRLDVGRQPEQELRLPGREESGAGIARDPEDEPAVVRMDVGQLLGAELAEFRHALPEVPSVNGEGRIDLHRGVGEESLLVLAGQPCEHPLDAGACVLRHRDEGDPLLRKDVRARVGKLARSVADGNSVWDVHGPG